MTKKTEQYRSFSSAAKEAGLDKDERKLVALEPELLLEGTSEQLRQRLSPELLLAFFRVLQKDKSVSEGQLLKIGNLLYSYRDDSQKKEGENKDLNEKDRRLVRLASVMLENAFYENMLSGLGPEQAAPLAFITNILAKMNQSSSGELGGGFSKDKLNQLTEEVSNYEQQALFSDKTSPGTPPSREEAENRGKRNILQEVQNAETARLSLNPQKYFLNLADTIEQVPKLLVAAGIIGHDDRLFNVAAEELRKHWQELFISYEQEIEGIKKEMVNKNSGYSGFRKPLSVSTRLFSYVLDREELKQRGLRHDSITNKMEQISKEIDGLVDQPQSKQKFKGLEEFGSEFTRTTAIKKILEIKKPLKAFLKTPLEDSFGAYVRGYEKVGRQTNQLRNLQRQADLFEVSKDRINQRINNGVGVTMPYLIKSCLIADSLTSSTHPEVRLDMENKMAMLNSPFNYEDYFKNRKQPPSHSFKNRYDDSKDPSYSDLHFIPEELPFAVWTLRYLRAHDRSPKQKP